MKKGRARMQTLLIDNYDSYTYNLYQYLATINGSLPIVIFNDSFKKWRDVELAYPNLSNVVISPGPGSPEKLEDFGVCLDCILTASVPVLGVCLGHQGISFAYGGEVVKAPEVMHGRTSNICFSSECDLFDGLTQNTEYQDSPSSVYLEYSGVFSSNLYFVICFYPFRLPTCLKISCWTNDCYQLIMGLQHESRPLYGIQFHPESVSTIEGYKLLQNFRRITEDWWMQAGASHMREFPLDVPVGLTSSPRTCVSSKKSSSHETPEELQLMEVNIVKVCFRSIIAKCLQEQATIANSRNGNAYAEPVDMGVIPVDSVTIFSSLFREYPVSFWLDSSSHKDALQADNSYDEKRGRFSYMGNAYGPLSEIIKYYGKNRLRHCHHRCASSSRDFKIKGGNEKNENNTGKSYEYNKGGFSTDIEESIDIFNWLKQYLSWFSLEAPQTKSSCASFKKSSRLRFCEWSASVTTSFDGNASGNSSNSSLGVDVSVSSPTLLSKNSTECAVPFDFVGGFAGFFGYETCEDAAAIRNIRKNQQKGVPTHEFMDAQQPQSRHDETISETLDSLWIFADRLIVYDHKLQNVFLVWLAPLEKCDAGAGHTHPNSSVKNDDGDGNPSPVSESLIRKCISGHLTEEDVGYIHSQQRVWVESILRLFAREIQSSSEVYFNNLLKGFLYSQELIRSFDNPIISKENLEKRSNEKNGFMNGRCKPVKEICINPSNRYCSNTSGMRRTASQHTEAVPLYSTTPEKNCLVFKPNCSRRVYIENIKEILQLISEGETYEVCLTNQLKAGLIAHKALDPYQFYQVLRKENAAPYGAFLWYKSYTRILNYRISHQCFEYIRPFLQLETQVDFYFIILFWIFFSYDTKERDIGPSKSNGNACSEDFVSLANSPTDTITEAGDACDKPCDSDAESRWTFSLCCSSPERFLKMDQNGVIESKPIKGTIARGKSAAEDASNAENLRLDIKERAENLMIVDLVRNDLGNSESVILSNVCAYRRASRAVFFYLMDFGFVELIMKFLICLQSGRVCIPGTVEVPGLLQIESFSTVHQLVSTIRGTIASPKFDAIEAIAASFPGGSMTGAPKHRTQFILQRLEGQCRGAYSGSLGFISINGSFDLNIIIRTACWTENKISVGAGGAIVALSNPEKEYEEMLLKANATINALRSYCEMLYPKMEVAIQLDELP
ncbi:p-aminobenzoic acid synthase [Cardiosporidium cionae]|uniref:aminodeoxychorismate synthase n=1 Tax=Cardiosporidium cionae TaxID=476202 RepID=A0ABQ7JBL2_9APIC|nr:p-aminobenzoic acid synthase [Cardiosporidium cionae]|eukprot:KAF8821340.1 p-aminobenzoic acid synthase [Cardiosporidium cionae]